MDNQQLDSLVTTAINAINNAHNPYSNFGVGSAVLTKNGKIFSGCNIENASYGATICAERVALYKAISEGYKKFSHIAIACDKDVFPTPCGICLQVLSEFCSDIDIVLINKNGEQLNTTLNQLLPSSFKLNK